MHRLPLFIAAVLTVADCHALSPEAAEGKALYPACHVCHNPALDPPLGPPMWGAKRRYEMGTLDDEDFRDGKMLDHFCR